MRICVYLGSSAGRSPVYREAATQFGTLLAQRGIGLVYGGGEVGLMGVIADAVCAAGGEVIGVIPEALRAREKDHHGITELHVVKTMHERKAMMANLADGFVTLPGGIGTFEEMFEAWCWAQLGYHKKPVGLLNVGDFYDGLTQFIDKIVEEGFLQERHRAMLMIEREPEALLDRMMHYMAPETEHWLGAKDL
ncbi:LOG family protein [Novosphingobium beihaiensis]|uniref:Cytokinin riboside 5'-monophosphate phosphoribohydrolase n=1 Tax=Novosphingobium beihaiensis TaxID=2930389 RepID=A0ABT0BNX5_9SPHN|nr:TIGR00730 family Rossman fold protein [Novosphingobium beihaiensis]MCJ2186752.1 TIGR00730 family Rossman fold protein [Novosphingobium beihaiensis]